MMNELSSFFNTSKYFYKTTKKANFTFNVGVIVLWAKIASSGA